MNYSIKEASEYLKVSADTIRRRIKEGKIQAHKVDGKNGPQWVIPEEELTGNNATQIIEVVPVRMEITPEVMQKYIMQAMEQVETQHKEELQDLKEEVKALNENVQVLSSALEKALDALQSKQEEVQEVQEAPVPKKRWKFWRN